MASRFATKNTAMAETNQPISYLSIAGHVGLDSRKNGVADSAKRG